MKFSPMHLFPFRSSVHILLIYVGGSQVCLLFLQSGKSAAIYACAKEQGFQVIEVMLNTKIPHFGAVVGYSSLL